MNLNIISIFAIITTTSGYNKPKLGLEEDRTDFYDDVGAEFEMRLFDAEDLNPEQQKHLVRLDIELWSSKLITNVMCSGSIISKDWIITSAHCFMPDDDKTSVIEDIHVVVERQENNRLVKLGEVSFDNIIVHPDYVHNTSYPSPECDLAVIRTTSPLKLSKILKPIKLNRRPYKPGKTATVAGYGLTEMSIVAPKQGLVAIHPCKKNYGNNLLCSNNLVRPGPGDSGGPLQSKSGRLLGVTSSSCVNVHIRRLCEGVFVDVAANLDWIESHTGVY